MRYLTVQDVIWIHSLMAETPGSFDYSRLEEACFYQYGYGASIDLPAQAARFLAGFITKSPFATRNVATALASFAAFLLMNGKRLDVDTRHAIELAMHPEALTAESLEAKLADSDGHEPPGVEEAVGRVFEQFHEAIDSLSDRKAA